MTRSAGPSLFSQLVSWLVQHPAGGGGSVRTLADTLELSRNTLSRYTRGNATPSASALQRLEGLAQTIPGYPPPSLGGLTLTEALDEDSETGSAQSAGDAMVIVSQGPGKRGRSAVTSIFEEGDDIAVIVLTEEAWAEHGLQTLWRATLRPVDGAAIELGPVKIVRRGQRAGRAELPARAPGLGDQFASLGQDPEYYERINALDERLKHGYLRAMRDAAFLNAVYERFRNEEAWRMSVVRFSQAENALDLGRRILRGRERKREGLLSFRYARETEPRLSVEFAFDASDIVPGRANVLVGYNGSGKTRLLADLAVAASRVDTEATLQPAGQLTGDDTNFGQVIAVSYSAFDDFARPSRIMPGGHALTEFFGYVYCGLRTPESGRGSSPTTLKSLKTLTDEFVTAMEQASDREEGPDRLEHALGLLSSEPSFERAGIDPVGLVGRRGERRRQFTALSTGHKIVIHIVTQLAAHLKTRSLVLIDEPESHLHPPLTAALMRALDYLLSEYDSFSIIATHSPVLLQEVPSRFVRVLSRIDDRLAVEPIEIETFGENVGTITRHVFSLDSSVTDYQGVIKRLAENMTLAEAETLFEGGLGPTARALFLNLQKSMLWD